jgi:hypothetical protein
MMSLALLGVSSLLAPQSERELTPAMEIMWRKLDLSHDVLDALALEDFEALEAYASDLVSVSDAARDLIPDNATYREQNLALRRAASALDRAARRRDTNAAALAYVDLTLRCVGCHRTLGGGTGE